MDQAEEIAVDEAEETPVDPTLAPTVSPKPAFNNIPPANIHIRNVWKQNLDAEFVLIRKFIKTYNFVAFDTEFPGVVATPTGSYKNKEEYQYHQIACNVNVLKPIQIGFCLMDENGGLPAGGYIWQFNFQFDLGDLYSVDSVDLLKKSGIDFEKHWNDGMKCEDFGMLLTTSDLLCNPNVTWVTFHSCFDFSYLIRTILLDQLPDNEKEFLKLHEIMFPVCFDIKVMLKHPALMAAMLRGGLQDVADQLCVQRIGTQHQAGSDSLLTAKIFFRIKNTFFAETWKEVSPSLSGHMFGLGEHST